MKSCFTRLVAAAITTGSLLGAWGTASAAPYVLVAFHQRSTSGALSSLFFKSGAAQGCMTATPYRQPCYSPTSSFALANPTLIAEIEASPATWDWSGTTLTQTGGLLWATSFIGSVANGTPVISDKITGLTITPSTTTTTATTYQCIEGSFLAGVGANGCLNLSLGANNALDSSVTYNVGGAANCINRIIAGDDVSTGNTRGVTSFAGGGGCDPIDGGFNQWTIVPNPRFLILSNTASIIGSDGCYMFGRASEKAGSLTTPPCVNDMALAGASYLVFAPQVDGDGDGVVNALDNCTTRSNPLASDARQPDSNGDGYGNRCDGDLNNNGSTNAQDTTLYRQQLGQPSVAPTYNAADINANGAVNAQDTTLFRGLLGAAPGPSGICLGTYPCPANP